MTKNSALCVCLTLSAGLLASGSARAAGPQQGEFAVERFTPAPGATNYLTVEQVRMDGGWGWSAGLVFDYARDPFVLRSCLSKTDCGSPNVGQPTDIHVVQDMMTFNLLAAVSPIKILQIGVRLPLEYNAGQGVDPNTGLGQTGGLAKFGLGDSLLEGKLRLFGGAQDPYLFGVAGGLIFPTGHATANGAYIGNDSPLTGEIRGIFDGKSGPLSFGLNFAGTFRKDATLGTTTVGPVDFRYGVASGFQVSPVFRVIAEGFGATQFQTKKGTNNLEIDGAFEIKPLDWPVFFRAGGGAGIVQGVGVPAGRAIFSIMFTHEIKDTDGDGIPDNVDKCPTLPEDFDGFEDADGCPDPDNDKDGIPDEKDACPNVAGEPDPDPKKNGCPHVISDRDHDGVPDDVDKCPDEGGRVVKNPKSPYYGCPDRDGDGIADKVDKCPDEPEDFDGFEDADGCPDPDNDHDGIPDELDECINEPENYNGYQDADGCPDTPPNGPAKLVDVTATEIKILETIEFDTAKATIKGARSFQILDAVSSAMKNHKEIVLVEIAGHTDNVGPAPGNRKLSQQRAESVEKYLEKKGVDGGRMQPKGYGPDEPIADNKTPDGRQKNRRVEFRILKQEKIQSTPKAAPTAEGEQPPAAPAAAPPPAKPALPPPPKKP